MKIQKKTESGWEYFYSTEIENFISANPPKISFSGYSYYTFCGAAYRCDFRHIVPAM